MVGYKTPDPSHAFTFVKIGLFENLVKFIPSFEIARPIL